MKLNISAILKKAETCCPVELRDVVAKEDLGNIIEEIKSTGVVYTKDQLPEFQAYFTRPKENSIEEKSITLSCLRRDMSVGTVDLKNWGIAGWFDGIGKYGESITVHGAAGYQGQDATLVWYNENRNNGAEVTAVPSTPVIPVEIDRNFNAKGLSLMLLEG